MRELDDRQEGLRRIDTRRTGPSPLWIEPARHPRKSRWGRFVLRLKALFLRSTSRH